MRFRLAAVAAAALALTGAAAWPGPAGTVHAQPPAARTCTAGTIGYSLNQFAPSNIASAWISNGCGQYESPEILDNGGGYHYGDSWRTGVGVNSVASSPNAFTNGKAWNRYKNSPSGQIYCHRVFPTVGSSWFKANGSKCG